MWIVFAILARLFWAIGNAVDQVIARAHPRHAAMAALVLELLTRLPFALAGYCFLKPIPYDANILTYSAGAVVGVIFGLVPYYAALKHEQAHNVTPYMEMTPVFLIILAYVLKGEVLTPVQLAGAVIVIASGFLFSWDFARSHFKIRIFILLAVASAFFAFCQYCVGEAGIVSGVLAISCHFYFLSGLAGVVIFAAMKNVRRTILTGIRRTKGGTLYLGLATNVVGLLAIVALILAFRFAPTIGHVGGLSGAQPIFSFALAFPLARFLPKHFSKITFDREMRFKMILVLSIAFGVYLLATG